METRSELVNRYIGLINILFHDRDLFGGVLSQNEEPEWASKLESLWNQMSLEEQEEIEDYIRHDL